MRGVRKEVDSKWEATVAALRPALHRIALRLCHSQSDADDLVQDTCERALLKSDRFDGRRPLRRLATIMRGLFLDRCRANAIDEVPAAPPPDQQPPWADIGADELHAAVTCLPEGCRDTYRLRAFEKLSYEQISERLGIRINTVGSKLRRARETLRGLLEERIRRERKTPDDPRGETKR